MTAPVYMSEDGTMRWAGPTTVGASLDILDRMERAVMKVRERLIRATAALNQSGVPYAVVGGNAVAHWVATVDEGAVRNTPDVDLLVRRTDLPVITAVLQQAGFVVGEFEGSVISRDGPEGKCRDAVYLVFASEKARTDHLLGAPEIETVLDLANFHVLTFNKLVVMKLVSYRLKDRVHLRDLIGVGLIDRSWLDKVPPELAERLRQILDTPDG